MSPEQITLTEAGRRKNCRHSCISKALKDGILNGVRIGDHWVGVKVDRRFQAWQKGPAGQRASLRLAALRQRERFFARS